MRDDRLKPITNIWIPQKIRHSPRQAPGHHNSKSLSRLTRRQSKQISCGHHPSRYGIRQSEITALCKIPHCGGIDRAAGEQRDDTVTCLCFGHREPGVRGSVMDGSAVVINVCDEAVRKRSALPGMNWIEG